ncbi:MAG: excisionase family DNA-binding protein [Aeromicrobium sp.]|uniref:excisionase family DNA-binding protein n=1 Tax=Aeromicrobium sp. TaxID=1871063 RepID=UPI00260AD635|nr:excisionase family DNA-binding protein [Aeromicrobium sp.]MDF1704931.1 excisionase family DNA-binding protein [Aeromicrobium sp.]
MDYVTLLQAAELMSVSVKTVRRRIADGTLPAYRCGRRVIRVRIADLDSAFHRIPSARW